MRNKNVIAVRNKNVIAGCNKNVIVVRNKNVIAGRSPAIYLASIGYVHKTDSRNKFGNDKCNRFPRQARE